VYFSVHRSQAYRKYLPKITGAFQNRSHCIGKKEAVYMIFSN
jgi:hypothetical protein